MITVLLNEMHSKKISNDQELIQSDPIFPAVYERHVLFKEPQQVPFYISVKYKSGTYLKRRLFFISTQCFK